MPPREFFQDEHASFISFGRRFFNGPGVLGSLPGGVFFKGTCFLEAFLREKTLCCVRTLYVYCTLRRSDSIRGPSST